jgi:hypothetical protein
MMTKKHFKALAEILKNASENEILKNASENEPEPAGKSDFNAGWRAATHAITQAIAYFCQRENPNFDRGRFLSAAGPERGK